MTDGENVYESEAIIENTAAREINTFANGWQRVYVTFPFDTEPVITDTNKPAEMFGVNVDVSLVCDASAGTVWFSCPQVEVGEVANMFNLIMNADFAETVENTENTSLKVSDIGALAIYLLGLGAIIFTLGRTPPPAFAY